MKREQYDEPIMKILCFEGEDIVRTSDNWTDPMPSEYNYG